MASSASEHSTSAHSEHSAGGLPQMKIETFAGQLFWLAIAFVLLYVAFSAVALPRLARVIETRKNRIQADIDDAERAKRKSEEAVKAYEHALAEARTRARKLGDDMRAQVQAKADKANADAALRLQGDVGRAEARISAMRNTALAQVGEIAAEAAHAMVERLSGLNADRAQIKAAVTQVLAGKS